MAFIKKNILWLVLGLLVLGGGGFALYHFVFKKKTDTTVKKETDTPAVEPLATAPAGTPKKEDPRLKDMIANIKNNAKWLADITAKSNGKDLETEIRNNAQWMLDEQDGKHK
jgi:hypothetical protein